MRSGCGVDVETDVVVVGGGYAGLAAALRLTDSGVDVVVLEAADRVGGRVHSERRPGGVVLDHGGQWVGPTQKHLLDLADRFGCPTFPTWERGRHVEVWHDGTRRLHGGAVPDGAPGVAEYLRITALLDELALTVDLEQPWATPRLQEWDGLDAGTFFRSTTADDAALRRLALAVQGVWSAEPREISLFHLLFYIRAAGGYTQLMETEGCAQDSRFVDGADAPARAVARLLGDRVRCGQAVRSVERRDGGGTSRFAVRTDDLLLAARRVVVTLPPPALRAVIFRPALSPSRAGWLDSAVMGRVAKVHAVYEQPFWRAEGLSGIATLYDDGPLGVVFDNSPADGSAGVLVGFVYGDRVDGWSALDAGARRAGVLAGLTRVVGPRAGRPVEVTERIWPRDPFVHGGYEAFLAPGGWTAYGERGWRTAGGGLHWAGTETASSWNGYIDGAIASGYRAAEEVVAALTAPAGTGQNVAHDERDDRH